MKNRIKELRSKKGITQVALANLVGTSQQQIQRIEAGLQSIRLEILPALCAALETDAGTIFPELKLIGSQDADLQREPVDRSATLYTLRIGLKSGDVEDFHTSKEEYDRVRSALLSGSKPFICFDSIDEGVFFAPDKVAYCHFLFDPMMMPNDGSEHSEREQAFTLWFDGQKKPLKFEVDWDRGEGVGEFGDVGYVFYNLDTLDGGHEILAFVDVDGEEVIFSSANLAFGKVPREVTSDELQATIMDGYSEEES